MSCIYEPDEGEISREQHIADHLGVTIEEVRTERIGDSAAHTIANRFREISARDVIGTAYDTLFKKLCGEGSLQTVEGKTVLAPFAFVSTGWHIAPR